MPEPENPPSPASNPPPENDPSENDWQSVITQWEADGLKPAQVRDRLSASRKWEERAKANAEAAKRLDEIENATKSDQEKYQAAITAKEASDKEASDVRQELVRLRVAHSKGLSVAQAKRLVGTTEEELEADAEELLTTFKPAEPPNNGNGNTRPRENLRPGAKPEAKPEEMDPVKLAEAVPR